MANIRLLSITCRPLYKRSLSFFYTTSSFPSARIPTPTRSFADANHPISFSSNLPTLIRRASSSIQTKRKWVQWTSPAKRWSHLRRLHRRRILSIVLVIAVGITAYLTVSPFRHFVIAVDRCGRVGLAVALNIIDYKILFARTGWEVERVDNEKGQAAREKRHDLYSECHSRCAKRILNVLLTNGVRIFINSV